MKERRRIAVNALAALVLAAVVVAAPARPGWLGLGFIVKRGSDKSSASWIYVQRLAPGGPAERSGIRPQDIITAIDGATVRFADTSEALAHFANLAPGTTLTFSILRQHRNLTVRVRATELPEEYRALWLRSRSAPKQ